jgi:release factor glutamine methyltransferase
MTSLRAALGAAQARLAAAGVPDAAGDARRLLAHAVGVAPERLSLALDEGIEGAAAERLEAAILARQARQPVSQIIGGRWFWAHWFIVTPDVLDPRPETETLVAAALERPFTTVLDLGTGSGAIVLSLLAARPGAQGVGCDVSPAALQVAARNRAALGLEGRAELRLSDWFSAIEGRFDLVVSNPPYIAQAEMPTLAPEVRDWEPALALTPGGDGLDAYRMIARDALRHMAPGGTLLLEIGPTQGAAVSGLLRAAGFGDVTCLCDLDGRERVVRAHAP